jgi:hypothetical protein
LDKHYLDKHYLDKHYLDKHYLDKQQALVLPVREGCWSVTCCCCFTRLHQSSMMPRINTMMDVTERMPAQIGGR